MNRSRQHQHQRQPAPIRQRDLLNPPCRECKGEGRVAWAVTLGRGGRRGTVDYQTCHRCRGTGWEPQQRP